MSKIVLDFKMSNDASGSTQQPKLQTPNDNISHHKLLKHHQNHTSSFSDKKTYKCTTKKCRFTCFSLKSLTRHQLQHRRLVFVSIIEPFGFTLNQFFDIIPKIRRERVKLIHCCFPFCQAEFMPEHGIDYITNHFALHMPSYISFPCFHCLKMFNTKQLLFNHLKTSPICIPENVDSLSNGWGLFPEEEVNKLMKATEETNFILLNTGSSVNSSLIDPIACPFCRLLYKDKKWLDVHISLIHGDVKSQVKDSNDQQQQMAKQSIENKVIELIDDDDECHTHSSEFNQLPKKFKCKFCSEPFDSESAIETHAKFFHNLALVDILETHTNFISDLKGDFHSN